MKTVAFNSQQAAEHFSRQSPTQKKLQQVNYGNSYHMAGKQKPYSMSQKHLSPNQFAPSPNKGSDATHGKFVLKNSQQQVVQQEYDSPAKEVNKKQTLNKQNSLSLSQCSVNQNGQLEIRRKGEKIPSFIQINPKNNDNKSTPLKVGQTPKFFQNGKSMQISTINSIANISQYQGYWTGTEFGSQLFGTPNELVNEKIIQICTQKIEEDPTNIKLYQKRLQQYMKSGELDCAVKDAEYILRREPTNIFALFSKGNVFMQRGEIEKALADFEQVLVIDPDNVNAALARASCWNLKGDYVKAIDQYEDALEKDIEKTSMLNLSINLKRNFKSSTSSQTCHIDRIEKEDQFSSDIKQFNGPLLDIKKLQSQVVSSSDQKQGSYLYQNLQRSQSDQVSKDQKAQQQIGFKITSLNGSECQSPVQTSSDPKQNNITSQSAFSKNKQSSNTDQQELTKQTNNTSTTQSEEKVNEQANFYFTKGYCARQRKDYWKAIELYSHALSLKPDFLKAVFNRGFLFDKLNQHEKAVEDYTRSIEIDEKCAFAFFNRGISLNKLNRSEKAIEDFTIAIQLDHTNSDFYLNRANTYQKLDMHKEAIKDYTSCIDFSTDKLPSVLISRAMSYEKNNEIERARHDYQRALDIGTNQKNICYSRLATIYFYDGNLQLALTLYNKALEIEPNSLYCLAKRAQLYIKLELYKLASEDLTNAIIIRDDIDALYYYRGKAFKFMGKLIESTEDLLHASQINPNDPNIYRFLSKNMLELDQYEDSINYTTKEIELIGPSKQSLFNRAFCYNKLNKFEEAEKDLQVLLKDDSDNIKLQKSISVCFLNQKKYDEALNMLNKVIEKLDQSEVSEYYKYRSECHHYLKNQQKAEEDLKMHKLTLNKS